MTFTKRKGRATFSLGRRGPRLSYRLGCLVPALLAVALAGCGSGSVLVTSAHDDINFELVAAKTYKNCTKLNKHYPHGVGKPNAVDKVSGSTAKVTNFYRSKALYKANKKSDRDKDGIACEKR